MTDYFALLDQPRAPWLNPAELKERFHQKILQTHPDTQTGLGAADKTDASFARLNEAYQVLQDPKRRLHHLLSLEGAAPLSAGQAVPKQLQDLFPEIGSLTQLAHALLEKINAISNALSLSLLKPEILKLQGETKAVREKLQKLQEESLAELQALNKVWSQNPRAHLEALTELYYTFAYLTRWTAQLDEVQFQFSQH
jgi:curved DNA-binding protein CbpA